MKVHLRHLGCSKSLILILLLGVTGMTKAFAQTQIGSRFYNNGFIYEVTQMTPNRCVTLVGWDDENQPTGTLRIEEPVIWDENDWTVSAIGDGALAGYNGITSVEILYGVESIGSNAFKGCTGLTSVVIQHVKAIGSNAFKGCTRLEEVYFVLL